MSFSRRVSASFGAGFSGGRAPARLVVVAVVAGVAGMLGAPQLGSAATITVNTVSVTVVGGDGNCTLPEAVANANTDSDGTAGDCAGGTGADTIDFSVSGTITLAARLTVNDADLLIVDGTGQTVTLSGGNAVGIFLVVSGAGLEVRRLTLTAGSAASGGAIDEQNATLTVVESTLIGNNSTDGAGGGVRGLGGTVTVLRSLIANNDGGLAGGGISLEGAVTATIGNSTVTGNTSALPGGQGGGVFVGLGATLTLTNSTVAGNDAVNGGGIRNLGTVRLSNTIVSGNTASTAGPDCTGSPTSLGNNLIQDTTGCAFVPSVGDLTGANALLGALADNGGLTQTMALDPLSPALDAGDNATCAAAPISGVDQRGVTRPQGPACDIGAFELERATTTTTLTSSVNPSQFGQLVTFTATVSSAVGPPTGSVTFQVDGGSAVVVPLDGAGQATFSTSTLTVGTHTIEADYTSDTSTFLDSSATPLAQIVSPFATTTTLTSSANPSLSGQLVTFTAMVSSAGGTPTGSVTFQVDGGSAVVVPLDGAGQATFSTSALTVGTHTIEALYTSDTSAFLDSSAAPLAQLVVAQLNEIPTLSGTGKAVLVLLLLASVMWMLGRRQVS